MLPCPAASAGFGLGNVAFLVDVGINQGDIACVHLRLHVHQLKDPLGAGQSQDDGVDLVGNLGDGLVEGAAQEHEGHQIAQLQQFAAGGDHQEAAHDGQNRILDITQVVIHRAHHVGQTAGGIGVVAELVIELVEFVLADFFPGEDLDDLLAVDHFFHIAVEGTEGFLLADEVFAGLAHHGHGHEHDAGDGEHGDNGQNPGGLEHGGEDHHQCDDGGEGLGDGLGNHLPEGINVAGVAGHDVAGGIGVEVAQGELLHFGEQLIANGFLGALANPDHQELLEEIGQHTGTEDTGNTDEVFDQRGVVRGAGGHHGQNVVIHQIADVLTAPGLGNGGDHDADHYGQQVGDVIFQIAQQAKKGLFGILGLALVSAEFHGRHYSSPPFCWE